MARGSRADRSRCVRRARGCRLEEVPARIANLQSELREANQKLKAALTGGSSDAISSAIENAVDCGSYKLVIAQLDGLEAADLRNVWDTVRQKGGSAVACVIATVTSKGQPALLAAATDEAVAAGFKSGDVIKKIAPWLVAAVVAVRRWPRQAVRTLPVSRPRSRPLAKWRPRNEYGCARA